MNVHTTPDTGEPTVRLLAVFASAELADKAVNALGIAGFAGAQRISGAVVRSEAEAAAALSADAPVRHLVTVNAARPRAEAAMTVMNDLGALNIDAEAVGGPVTGFDEHPAGGDMRPPGAFTSDTVGVAGIQDAADPVPANAVHVVMGEPASAADAERGRVVVHTHMTVTDGLVRERMAALTGWHTFEPAALTLTELRDEPVITVQARVVEEVVIGKDVREAVETVRETARQTGVVIETFEGETVLRTEDGRARHTGSDVRG
jgi:hypothetical protein